MAVELLIAIVMTTDTTNNGEFTPHAYVKNLSMIEYERLI